MKRDMDLIRDILLRFEASENERNSPKLLHDLGSDEAIGSHLRLLKDGGLVDETNWKPFSNGVTVHLGWRITSAGHDFLDTIRDPEIWQKTKSGAGKLGGWTVKLLSELASGYVRAKAQELGLPL